jgi:hypothetical protein
MKPVESRSALHCTALHFPELVAKLNKATASLTVSAPAAMSGACKCATSDAIYLGGKPRPFMAKMFIKRRCL